MKVITFKGYGANSTSVSVVASQISHFYPIDYNGNYGTCIVLVNGKEINVGDWEHKVKENLESIDQ